MIDVAGEYLASTPIHGGKKPECVCVHNQMYS